MINANEIKPEMPVVCSQGGKFATVDHIEGTQSIKLKKDDSGQHHYIPLNWVSSVENGTVKVDRPGKEVMKAWSTAPTA